MGEGGGQRVDCVLHDPVHHALSTQLHHCATRPRWSLAHIVGAVAVGLIVGGCFYKVKLTIAGSRTA